MRNPAIIDSAGTTFDKPLTSTQIEELQRFAELGRLCASLLHEISNPLTAAMLHLEQSGHRRTTGIRQVHRNMQLLKRYVEAARQQVRQQSRSYNFSVGPQVEQLKHIVQPLARGVGVQLVIQPLPTCRLNGDPVKFQQILANLIVNAIDAYTEDTSGLAKPVQVRGSVDGGNLVIEVIDWGQGITAEQLGRLFEPFYTTKNQANRGLGIGLTIVQQYTNNDFGGSISVTSSARAGTRFKLSLPLP
jgi:C4-dicarboxylate-specific signal transduction histidine kinase